MNQTGGMAKKSSSAAQKTRTDYHQNVPSAMLNPDNYIEKPRPNFYNVLKNIRESRVFLKFVYV